MVRFRTPPLTIIPEASLTLGAGIRYTASDAGQPYKVIGVCLPFVYAKTHRGRIIVIDTRQRQLVRLDQACASAVWEKMKSPSKKARK